MFFDNMFNSCKLIIMFKYLDFSRNNVNLFNALRYGTIKEIYEAVVEEKRIDTVYLDFAKAFDKVDHSILIKKVKEHGIGGKIGKWLIEFLTNRKFRVVANGSMSEEGWVKSGVPQGTVLAAILFVIMISDIDDEIKKELIDNVKRKMEEDE